MKIKTLNINQTDVTEDAVLYTCFGLGSCIALFVNDRMTGLAGGAHIPVAKESEGDLRSGGELLDELLAKFRSKGSSLTLLRAKIAGGAQILNSRMNIGKDNIELIRRELVDRRVLIAAEDLGGCLPRTARFNTRTGDLVISSGELSRMTI
jgi:chemotaxis protein CheD